MLHCPSGVFVGEVYCIIFKILMESVSYFVDALSLTSVSPFCPRNTCNASLLAPGNDCTLALQTVKLVCILSLHLMD